MVQEAGERIEAFGPELFIARQPHGGLLHRLGRKLAAHDTAFFRAGHEPGVLEHAQVLHEAGERHVVRLRKLAHGAPAALAQGLEHGTARRIGERGENRIEGACI